MRRNRYFVRAQRWAMLSLSALALCTGCTREEEEELGSQREVLSIQNVEVATPTDWMTRSTSDSANSTAYVKLGDSLLIYARVEALERDTTATAVTRGTPIVNVNDLSDMRMNLYSGSSNWSSATPPTEVIKISRSGRVYVTSPSYNWSSNTDKITLLTYTPLPSAANGLTEGANGNTVAYTVPTDVTKQPDFCATNPTADNSIDVVNSDRMKHLRSLTFRHQLTAVGFALNGWNVKVSKIEVSGVTFSGTYNLRTPAWTPGSVGADSRLLGVNTSKVPTDSYKNPTEWTDITRSNGYLMMVPQTLTDKAKVQITYTDAAGTEQVIMALLQAMSSGKWQAGYKITYCIQLETAPSIGTNPISLYMPWKAGYTTTAQIPFVARDPQDRYTFKWGEAWNVIHRGAAKVNNLDGGAASGWYTAATNTTPIWFFTKESNPSTSSSRSSVVTLDAWRTVDRTFTVVQGMKPYITVEGMPSTSDLVTQAGLTATVTVKSNYPWESALSNVRLNPSWGAANTTGQRVAVTIPPGDGSEGAISALFKTTNDNKVPDLIASASYVYNREVVFAINPTTPGVIIPGVGATYTVKVTTSSSVSWSTRPSAGVTVSPSSGKGNATVTITVAGNPSQTSRREVKADFLVSSVVKATWSGTQKENPENSIIPTEVLRKAGWPTNRLPKVGLQVATRGNKQPGSTPDVDDPAIVWTREREVTNITAQALGAGKGNYAKLNVKGATYPIGQACKSLGSEWYVPSLDELKLIYFNKSIFGASYAFPADRYWSATESKMNYSWFVVFRDGYTEAASKNAILRGRCVREI